MLVATPRRQRTVPIDGDRLVSLREVTLVLTQRELAQKLRMSLSAYQNLESGRTPSIYVRTLRKMAKASGKTTEEVRNLIRPHTELDQNVESYSEVAVLEPPTFELAVAAGGWTQIEGEGQIYDPALMRQGLFRVRIRGDSMRPKYDDGDLVEFRVVRIDGAGLVAGRDYYVQKNDGEATFKRLESVGDETMTLRARNRKYRQPLVVERGLIVRLAVAEWILGKAS